MVVSQSNLGIGNNSIYLNVVSVFSVYLHMSSLE